MNRPAYDPIARRRAQRREAAAATLATLVVEALLTFAFVAWPAFGWLAVLGHVATSALLLWWGLKRRRRAQRYPALLAISTTALGLAGAVGATFASLAQRAYRSEARSFQTWYFNLFPPRTQRKARAWYDLSRALGDDDVGGVESFADLIRFGDIDQKLAIVALIARRFEPRFAPVLHAALQDPDASVRVQAATAAAHIENDFVDRWVKAKRRADARTGDAEAQGDLARLLDDYAFAGILDERRESELRAAAEACYREALARDPDNVANRLGFGRLQIRLGRHVEALQTLLPLSRDPSPEAAGWIIEALFRMGRFDELRRFCGRLDVDALPERLAAAVSLWRPAPLPAALTIEGEAAA